MNMTPKMEEEVLAVLRQPMDDVVGWVCHALETIFNGVMEVEAQRLTRRRSGKGPALDHRSGFYTRTYPSPFGPLELKEPRLRRSPFASALLACFEARQKKVKELVTAMHHEGLGTRPISRIMEDHLEEGMSHTTVSRICREAHGELEAWRTRPLTGPYPILALDALYLPCRSVLEPANKTGLAVGKRAVLIALGIKGDGHREVLGAMMAPREDAALWGAFIADLKERGLIGTRLVLGDGHPGLMAAVADQLPGCRFQSCAVHLQRRVLQSTQLRHRKGLAKKLRAIFTRGSGKSAQGAARRAMEWLAARGQAQAGDCLARGLAASLTYLAFSKALWRRIRTNNLAERINREVRRRTDAVGAFPDARSALMLVCARLRLVDRKWAREDAPYMDVTEFLAA